MGDQMHFIDGERQATGAFGTQRDINSVDFATQAHPFDRKYQDTIMMQWLYKF